MNAVCASGKLLIALVGRHQGERLVKVMKAAGARGGTVTRGRFVGRNRVMQMLALADVHQDITFTLLGEEFSQVIGAVREAHMSKKVHGIGVVLDVQDILPFVVPCQPDENTCFEARREKMESGYTLITVIINHGFADDVMVAARNAGAKGGTVLNACGTGKEEDVKFCGISLVPEKEILLIIVECDKKGAILEAIKAVPKLSEPGAGIAYTVNVEELITFGE